MPSGTATYRGGAGGIAGDMHDYTQGHSPSIENMVINIHFRIVLLHFLLRLPEHVRLMLQQLHTLTWTDLVDSAKLAMVSFTVLCSVSTEA